MTESGIAFLWLSLLLLGSPGPALACSCPTYPQLEEVATRAAVIVIGRVSRVTRDVTGWRSFELNRPSPVHVELDVAETLRGADIPKRVRVWDDQYGSSCEGVLARVSPGIVGVFALRIVSEEEADHAARTDAPVPAGEYVLPLCVEGWRRVNTEREAEYWRKLVG